MGSIFARIANSSINVSMTKAVCVCPTERNHSTGTLTVDDQSGLGLQSASALSGSALTDSLQSSLTIANKAVNDLGSLQEDISNTSNTLSGAQTTQSSFVTYLTNSLSNVKDVDTAQAAAQVQQYQTQLQASFLAVSTLTKLSLATFL